MTERAEDTDIARTVKEAGRSEDVLTEGPAAPKSGRSRNKDEGPGASDAQGSVGMAESVGETQPVAERQVMGGLTIRDLEMMPKMDEIRKLEEIPVGGTTNIDPEVIAAIAGLAAQSVDGVASLGTTSLRRTLRERLGSAEKQARGVEVEVGRREVILDINLRVIYGYGIPQIVVGVRHRVADCLLRLCGLEAKEINVRVVGIEFPSRSPGRVE